MAVTVCTVLQSAGRYRALGEKNATGSGAKLRGSLILPGLLSEVVELCYVRNKWPSYCVLFQNMLIMQRNKT